jgi:hypothetical protein
MVSYLKWQRNVNAMKLVKFADVPCGVEIVHILNRESGSPQWRIEVGEDEPGCVARFKSE